MNEHQEVDKLIKSQLEEQDHSAWTSYWTEITESYGDFLPSTGDGSIWDAVFNFDEGVWGWVQGLISYTMVQITDHLHLIFWLILLLLLSSFIHVIEQSFNGSNVAAVSPLILMGLVLITITSSIQLFLEVIFESLQVTASFLNGLLPLYIASITLSGGPATSAASFPILLAMVYVITALMKSVIVPLFIFSIFFDQLNCLTDRYSMGKVAALCRQTGLWILGVTAVASVSILSIQTSAAAAADGVAAKSVKTLAGTMLPFVGKVVSDTADLVMTSSMLAKNMIGAAGGFILMLLILFPAIKMLVIAVMYRLAAVVMEPVAGSRLTEAVDAASKGMFHLAAALLLTSCIFFISIIVVMFISNIPIMIR
ncbi:stage III sporulation protein AE [Jeotgalibacillus haloalkalitolerans]|uniref:Stage III sporulation protein AE n=1 Tax=Jeotgalibacillus haloalkalitolerans TaxID=3104292 RepID=A0ABU5KLJ5_9BACL|nr:stage III sporulation protein AE [Jeotgalibacillus sp. HH7-29]MDZ5712131.1 stage III sporulation protein AE [Jeotgalibacillus sp. HH7-29]